MRAMPMPQTGLEDCCREQLIPVGASPFSSFSDPPSPSAYFGLHTFLTFEGCTRLDVCVYAVLLAVGSSFARRWLSLSSGTVWASLDAIRHPLRNDLRRDKVREKNIAAHLRPFL